MRVSCFMAAVLVLSAACVGPEGPQGEQGKRGPTGPQGPTVQSHVAYYDDFNRATLGNNWCTSPTGQFAIRDGALEITGDESGYLAVAIPVRSYGASDFQIILDTEWISGIDNNAYSILFRDQGEFNSQYRFGIAANRGYILSDGITPIVDWTFSSDIDSKSSNELKVVCVGSAIECYVNGTLVVSVDDNTYSSGFIGLAVNEAQTVTFDNLEIWIWRSQLWKAADNNLLSGNLAGLPAW